MNVNLLSFLSRFPEAHIAVIGDLILDKFWFGDVGRLSPEAPVPVLSIAEEVDVLGGAANVGANIKSLGGEVSLFGIVGNDDSGGFLLSLLKNHNIDSSRIITVPSYTTPCKTRVIGWGSLPQHIVRIDKEGENVSLSKSIENKIIKLISDDLGSYDLIVISDYAKGCITPKIAKSVIEISKFKNKKVIADTKPINIGYYRGVYLIAPNAKEAAEIAGINDLEKAGRKIQNILNSNVLITKGGNGMILFQKNNQINLRVKERKVFDPVGAGDTVMAGLALSLAAGAPLKDAARIANHAAGVVITKRGTATASIDELKKDLLG